MRRVIIGLLVLLGACVSLPEGYQSPEIPVEIYSTSWSASRARLFCNGETMARKTIPLIPFRVAKAKLRLGGCYNWVIVIEDMNRTRYSTEPFPLMKLDELMIDVGPRSSQIYYRMMR